VERVSLGGEIVEDSIVSRMVNEIGWGLWSGCW